MDNELLRFARASVGVARGCVPLRRTKYAHPVYPATGVFAALLLRERLRLTYRGLEDLLKLSGCLRRLFGLRIVPDHSSLWWFARHHLSPEQIEAALRETVRRARCSSRHASQVALDSTGLWLSHTSRYFAWRAQRHRSQRGWLKWALALWIEPQMLLAQRVRPGPCGDFSDLVPLASKAADVMPYDQLIADAGYNSEANHRFCREQLGVDSLIPAKKRRSATVVATTSYRQEMVRRLSKAGNPEDRAAYRQRWEALTVMSVVKRRCGEALTARLEPAQQVQALLRGIAYNVQRLVILGSSS
jgi:hypothetical protein